MHLPVDYKKTTHEQKNHHQREGATLPSRLRLQVGEEAKGVPVSQQLTRGHPGTPDHHRLSVDRLTVHRLTVPGLVGPHPYGHPVVTRDTGDRSYPRTSRNTKEWTLCPGH